MARHAIRRATPQPDFIVAIEWADGSSSKVDFRAEIARGRALASLRQPAIFLHRLFVQSAGESLAWETPAGLVDFHADELWLRSHKSVAAE
ncbi:MAG: DUF2442 domain-containing protein [Reyranella sp.]|uniref:DUF2442 domain-containing protein n=1 Tax=Reyranella sp. TaxID=1929291 RepID=UPI001AC3A70C|nr:DUF2442 domain-containing protein [Reyranella sp.]MBN9089813.1 DUF2442 domain-containing protein [Reyranella sp.]